MTARIDTLVFDIGNVLIRWDAHAAYEERLGDRAAGMAAHHFTGPEALEADLIERGLL